MTRDQIKRLTKETAKLVATGKVGAPHLADKHLARVRELQAEQARKERNPFLRASRGIKRSLGLATAG